MTAISYLNRLRPKYHKINGQGTVVKMGKTGRDAAINAGAINDKLPVGLSLNLSAAISAIRHSPNSGK